MEKREEFYGIFDHTGDLGIWVRGASLPELFVHAAKALFHLITNLERVRVTAWQEISLEGKDLEDLMVQWLGEALFLHEARGWLFRDFSIERLEGNLLQARAGGEILQPDRHEIFREIKAVTYHGIEVRKTQEGWRARVLFDM